MASIPCTPLVTPLIVSHQRNKGGRAAWPVQAKWGERETMDASFLQDYLNQRYLAYPSFSPFSTTTSPPIALSLPTYPSFSASHAGFVTRAWGVWGFTRAVPCCVGRRLKEFQDDFPDHHSPRHDSTVGGSRRHTGTQRCMRACVHRGRSRKRAQRPGTGSFVAPSRLVSLDGLGLGIGMEISCSFMAKLTQNRWCTVSGAPFPSS